MIELDGLEAGGQFVRTAVALSALTEKPVKIKNVRGSRKPPGLKTQHMEGIRSIAELCDADVKGLRLGSTELEFYPKKLQAKNIDVKISTAGSIGLVLQALLILTSQLPKPIKIKFDGGGTFGKWAPSPYYLQHVLLPLLGDDTKIDIIRDGFYPKGSAIVEVLTAPLKAKPLNLTKMTKLNSISCISIAAKQLSGRKVAERQTETAVKLLKEKFSIEPSVEIKYVDAASAGSGMLIVAKTENSILGGDAIGELGKSAEDVAAEAVNNLIFEVANGAVDRHAGDMLLPYMAIAGSGNILVSQITHHMLTNISVIEKFLPVKFIVDGQKGMPGTISVGRA
ncbi:MAG: RNA 3'-terminal phosphate cyclase [Candidatus Aenigmatarchaeota archaeon]